MILLENEPTYQEWGFKLILPSHGELKGRKRYYRIFYGAVHWHTADPGNIQKACVPFVQYGKEENFERARNNGDIRETYPCHTLNQDLDKVMAAMKELREKAYIRNQTKKEHRSMKYSLHPQSLVIVFVFM
ncbi:hypothetical protein [Metabacillus litoralis]|uniref:hypothetical protein n=1 Tax=Metabacillus litoralis TaxID=152268 RepID=UPI000EF5D1E7|nr:hypothetical protein [Metabacillus litoralis]